VHVTLLHGKAAEEAARARRPWQAPIPMNISAPFIQRPIATALIMVGLLVGGLVALFRSCPVGVAAQRQLSDAFRSRQQLPGRPTRQTMASTVAIAGLEPAVRLRIPGLTQMTSGERPRLCPRSPLQFRFEAAPIDGAVSEHACRPSTRRPGLPCRKKPAVSAAHPKGSIRLRRRSWCLGITSDSLPLTVVDAYGAKQSCCKRSSQNIRRSAS